MTPSLRWLPGLFVAVLLAACGNRQLALPSSGASTENGKSGGGTFETTPDGSPPGPAVTMLAPPSDAALASWRSDGRVVTPPEDAAVAEAASSPPPDPVLVESCAALAAAGAPDTLVSFQWEGQVDTCASSGCWTYVVVENGCSLRVQRANVPTTVTMAADDCAAARAWATNAGFLGIIRKGTGCANGATPEAFELTLVGGEQPRFKTWGCDEATVALERACFTALVDRLVPP